MALERHPHAVDDVRRIHRRQPHVPLQAVEERRVREVRRADERGAQARRALEQPRLRVELGRARVERDANVGAQRDELVDRALLRRAHVRRRDHADSAAARLTPASASRRWRTPDQITNAQIRSTESAVASSARSSEPTFGWPSALTSRSLWLNGVGRQRRQRKRIAERRARLDALQHPRRERDARRSASVVERPAGAR